MDAYGWLHKAAYCCSYELCEGLPTDRCSSMPFCTRNHRIEDMFATKWIH